MLLVLRRVPRGAIVGRLFDRILFQNLLLADWTK
jgi:hypothetical protein